MHNKFACLVTSFCAAHAEIGLPLVKFAVNKYAFKMLCAIMQKCCALFLVNSTAHAYRFPSDRNQDQI